MSSNTLIEMPLTLSVDAVKEKFKPLWAVMDKNSDGALDIAEVQGMMAQSGRAGTKGEAMWVMQHYSQDETGKITFEHYISKMIEDIRSDEVNINMHG